jgi:argininosuccinate lyase
MRMMDGLLLDLRVLQLPDHAEIVASGATTTAVAEALAALGIPWRGAHDIVGRLVRAHAPADWTADGVAKAFADAGLEATDELVSTTLTAGQQPDLILSRAQTGSPGTDAVRHNAAQSQARAVALGREVQRRKSLIDAARERLLEAATDAAERGRW